MRSKINTTMSQKPFSKQEQFAVRTRKELENLEYPYLSELSDNDLIDALFKPTEHRLSILMFIATYCLDFDIYTLGKSEDDLLSGLVDVYHNYGFTDQLQKRKFIQGGLSELEQVSIWQCLFDTIKWHSKPSNIKELDSGTGDKLLEEVCFSANFLDSLTTKVKLPVENSKDLNQIEEADCHLQMKEENAEEMDFSDLLEAVRDFEKKYWTDMGSLMRKSNATSGENPSEPEAKLEDIISETHAHLKNSTFKMFVENRKALEEVIKGTMKELPEKKLNTAELQSNLERISEKFDLIFSVRKDSSED